MKRKHNPDGSFKENPENLPPSTYQTVTYDCQVKDCNSRYLVEEGLEKHMKNDHNEDGSLKDLSKKPAYQPRKRTSTFDCQIKDCNSRYLEQSGLDDHMNREHNPDGSFKETPEKLPPPAYRYRRRSSTLVCTRCDFKFPDKT